MPGSPSHVSKISQQSSADKCNTTQPSSSYYTPQPSSYIDQSTFLNPSTYGQISYEVDDSSTAFNYSYNSRRIMDSNFTPLSKYLEDSPHYGQGHIDASDYGLLNAPASVPPNFSYISEAQEPEPLTSIPIDDVQFQSDSLLNIPISPDDDQLEPDPLLNIPLPSEETSFEPESLLNIPVPPGDHPSVSTQLMEMQSPPSDQAQFEPEPLLNIPLPHDDAHVEPVTSVNIALPAYDARFDSGTLTTTQSPPDDARFSTPEGAPDSVHPISAPMSTENQYLRSPSEKSDGSNLTAQDAPFLAGQPAKKASRKDIENIRYESPKNHDMSWVMEAFYSSSEEFNSPDNFELKKSNDGEEVTQLDTDESDGRVSIVDRLFAMLQRAEGESGDEGGDEEPRTPQKHSKTPTKQSLQGWRSCFQPQVSRSLEPSHLEALQNTMQYSAHQIPMDYAGNLHNPSQVVGPSYQLVLPSTSSQYPQQHFFQQVLVGQNAQAPIRPAPDPPMFYNAPPPIYQGPPFQQVHQQFFQPQRAPLILPSNLSQHNSAYQEPWVMDFQGSQPYTTVLEQAQTSFQDLPTTALSTQEGEEGYLSESSITLEKSHRTSPSPSQTEYETSTDFESASIVRNTPEVTVQKPRPQGPPFEQKGPTRTKEIGPVPPPPPPSPGEERDDKEVECSSIVDQLERETVRLEEMSIREVANYDRQTEVEELRNRMCERFQRLYPNLISEEDNVSSLVKEPLDEHDDLDDGDPVDGKVIRNGVQLTTRYLALWFPDKKERAEMIPWNIVRKIKPIRLCFLDNRIGHGEYEEFNIGEFVNVTGHMMFAYGDGPEALDETRLFVLDIVRQQMNMLLRRVWQTMTQNYQRRVFTYANIFGIYKNHPIRLRRLVRYLVEQNRKRHMLYRVMVDQGRRRGQNYFENRMDVNATGSTEVLCLKKRAPHIYHALIEAGYEDQLEFLCEERRIQDCDPALTKIKMFLKKRNRHLSAEHKELLEYARRVSYCSRTGRLSAFRAHRFHEFLGFPDLQTDLIYILDFLARDIVMEVTYRAARARQVEREKRLTDYHSTIQPFVSHEKLAAEPLELCHYEEGLRTCIGWRENGDILFGEEEQCVTLSYGKNPWKWESDYDYNKREMAERQASEKDGSLPSRFAYVSSAELFDEHKKVLRGEYWDSCPEDLTKEAFAIANAFAAARQSHVKLPEPQVPLKWQQQRTESTKKEHERLRKLLETDHQSEVEKRLTKLLVSMVTQNNTDDAASPLETEGSANMERMTKLISAVVHKHINTTKT
ncbi:hypothetical protein GCK32_006669 [Trichostrongylus colubriformis]|uniref:Uncharacterized protein n=1 Tax=Trichostrongylus colubriformis TaxID=6319 RepID=A0AAN8F2B2_TRICO